MKRITVYADFDFLTSPEEIVLGITLLRKFRGRGLCQRVQRNFNIRQIVAELSFFSPL